MKKRILAMLLMSSLAISMTACGGTDTNTDAAGSDTTASAKADGSYRISFIMKTLSSEHWQYMNAGCKQFAADHPEVTVDVKGPPSETSYDEQQNEIETDMANSDYDAYVIAPLQADLVSNMIKGQTKPIIAVDTNIDAPEIVSFVGTGNENAAKQGAEEAVKAAKAAGWDEIKCIEIAGVQGDATNEARMRGYIAGVEENGGDFLENEIQYADAVADKAVVCMEAIMQTHPEGVAIICANNDDMAVAAARTAAENPAYANTIFLGFDGQKTACESILNDQLTMTIAQQAFDMGYKACETALAAAKGETVDPVIDSGAAVITKDNAQERIDTLNGYLGQ